MKKVAGALIPPPCMRKVPRGDRTKTTCISLGQPTGERRVKPPWSRITGNLNPVLPYPLDATNGKKFRMSS